jgi:hypothetical protein
VVNAKPKVAPRPSRRGGSGMSDALLAAVSSISRLSLLIILISFLMTPLDVRYWTNWDSYIQDEISLPARRLPASWSDVASVAVSLYSFYLLFYYLSY